MRPGLLLPSGQSICLCPKSRVLFVTSDSAPNGQTSDTVVPSVADTRIMRNGKSSIHHRLQNDHVRGVVKVSSPTILDTITAHPSVGTKCETIKTTSRGKPLNSTLPQRNDLMPRAKNDGTKSDTEKKRLTVNLPIETHNDFKAWCSQQGREMSEVIVEFVEQCIKKTSK